MTSAPNPGEDTAALADVLFTFMPLVVSHVNERLEPLDLNNKDQWALRTIDAPMPMKELARRMEFDPSYVTAVADRLEARGLVERQPHPTDRRIKNLVVTAKGERLKQELADTLWSGETVFSALSATQRRQLIEILERMIAANRDDG